MSDNLEQKIINKIKQEHLEPKPRWHFFLKEWLIWLAGALSLAIGSIAVSVIIYLYQNNDLFLYHQTDYNFSSWLLLSLPYFWIFFLILFILILFYNIKHSKHGYRYPLFLLIFLSVVFSIILGGVFYFLGLGEKIDNVLSRKAPFYDTIFNPHIDIWSHPEKGRLAGLVITNFDNNNFILLDRDHEKWAVSYLGRDKIGNNIIIGQPVRMVGRMNGQNSFAAQKIMKMQAGREFFRRHKPEELMNFNNDKFCPMYLKNEDAFLNLLKQYPELKQILEQDLINNKDLIKEISSKNPDFLLMIQSLELSPAVMQLIFDKK